MAAAKKSEPVAHDELMRAAATKLGEIDPLAVVVVSAAAIAGLCGQPGPVTRIVSAFASNDSKFQSPVDPLAIVGMLNPVTMPFAIWAILFGALSSTGNGEALPEPSKEQKYLIGLAMSNVVESATMYTLVKNDEVMKAAMDIAKEGVKGAMSLAGSAAIIPK